MQSAILASYSPRAARPAMCDASMRSHACCGRAATQRAAALVAARAAVNKYKYFFKLKHQGNHTLGNRGLADGEMGRMRCVYALEAHDSQF